MKVMHRAASICVRAAYRRFGFSISLAALVLAPGAPLRAQETAPGLELGVRGGITRFSDGLLDDGVTITAFPAGDFPFGTSAYFTYFTHSRTAIEPQAGIMHWSESNNSLTRLTLGLQVMQFAKSAAAGIPSGYGFIHAGMVGAASDAGSDATFQVGGGAGYRFVYRKTLGIRLEGRYRRWLNDQLDGANEISLGVGFGAILGAKED